MSSLTSTATAVRWTARSPQAVRSAMAKGRRTDGIVVSSQTQCEWLSKRSEDQREHGACQGGKPRSSWVCRGDRPWASHFLVRGSRRNARRREGAMTLLGKPSRERGKHQSEFFLPLARVGV